MKKITYVLTLFILLLTSLHVQAQDILRSKDLSTINVDYLTDDDLAKISAQLKSNNTTIEQVEPMALSKGMSQTEYDKLKAKLNEYSSKSTDNKIGQAYSTRPSKNQFVSPKVFNNTLLRKTDPQRTQA
jgi:hypothetical protein